MKPATTCNRSRQTKQPKKRIGSDVSPDQAASFLPRPGISRYWSAQVADVNGRKVRSSRMNSGLKVRGELRPGCDPKLPESWTNITEARLLLRQLLERVANGATAGHDPVQLRYADLRQLYLDDLAKNKRKSLRRNTTTSEVYTDSLTHLDPFMGYTKAGDRGVKVSQISRSMITKFENERKAAFASTGTINRALAALRRMFKLAIENKMLNSTPLIKTGKELKPRQGFLEIEDYDRLCAAFPEYVQNLFQIAFYTAMRREEILSLHWSQLVDGMLDLGTTKNGIPRMVPLLDGIPETIEKLRRANPNAGDNDFIYLNRDGDEIGSFEKVWQNTCVRLGVKTRLCGQVTTSHFSKGYDPAWVLDCCAGCRAIYEWPDYNHRPVEPGEYVGFIFHDLRRSGIRNLIRAGVDPTVAKAISGHESDDVFERYNITSNKDLKEAAAKTTEDPEATARGGG